MRLKRRAPGEAVEKFRRRQAQIEADAIRLDWESVTVVTVPETLNDRAADSWEPLLAVADAAGGTWPTRARLAAIALSADEDMPSSVGMRLLADIRDAFGEEDHLSTSDLLDRLHDLEEAPWGD
jgi:hypothetical protein